MEKIKLNIVALSHSVTQNQNYAVVLGEENGKRRLPIVIGGFEAQAIAISMEDMVAPRPLTHDLFKNSMDTFGVTVKEVVISDLLEGIFYAKLICEKDGETTEIDSRTSDAIALAVRYECPIYTMSHIMDEAGVIFEEASKSPEVKEKQVKKNKDKTLKEMSIDELESKLEDTISKENYELAADIRDEIKRRKDLG